MVVDSGPLLGSLAAKRCARRVHNEHDATLEAGSLPVPDEVRLRWDTARDRQAELRAWLVAELGPERCLDLSALTDRDEAVDLTLGALRAGVEVVLGGWLPDDVAGGRRGRPDLLVRTAGSAYLPGLLKGHRSATSSARGALGYSLPSAPSVRLEVPGMTADTRLDDRLQLAHHRRLLEACGHAADDPVGLVVGTDVLPGAGRVLVWHDLAEARYTTFSRSEGTKRRTAMERYDHEFDFRRRIAATAARRTGAADDPDPLVLPIFVDECDACPWFDACTEIAGADAASAHVRSGRLGVREWRALAALGVRTLEELAALVVDEALLERYLPEVADTRAAASRLADAVRRARMELDGAALERDTTGPIDVPRASVEVDLDIEWDPTDRVYLWGCLVRVDDAAPEYRSFLSWHELDEDSERALAGRFVEWLRSLVAEHGDVLVFHYSRPEPTYLARILGQATVQDLLARFVDLLPLVRRHYFGRDGHGLKKVAPAFGFTWADEDPGGLQSQVWLLQARSDDEEESRAARARLLAYNTDDTLATAAVREGLRAAR